MWSLNPGLTRSLHLIGNGPESKAGKYDFSGKILETIDCSALGTSRYLCKHPWRFWRIFEIGIPEWGWEGRRTELPTNKQEGSHNIGHIITVP